MVSPQSDDLVVCPDCDLLQRRVSLEPPARAYCCRCHAELYRVADVGLDVQLALSLAGLMVFVIANAFPLVSLDASGTRAMTTLFGSVLALWAQGMAPVAVLVFATAILIPALELLLMCYLLLPLRYRRAPAGFSPLLRLLQCVKPWCMIEVFLIGVLVALVKLENNARVAPGIGLWSLAALIVLLALNAGFFDPQGLWRTYQRIR